MGSPDAHADAPTDVPAAAAPHATPGRALGTGAEIPGPATPGGRAGLAALREEPERSVVALDFDGTLAPIVADPDQARAHPAVVPALARLAPRLRGVAIVTGRPAELAVRYGGFAGVPGLENLTVLGAYGAERWDAATGEVSVPPPDPGIAEVRAGLPRLLASLGVPEGVSTEDKGLAVAVHTRRAPDPSGAFAALREPLSELAARHGLRVEPGRFVLELRPHGVDKGVALTAYLAEKDAGPVLYAGDDLGDLAAFAAVEQRRAQGVPGVLVCSGSTEVTELADRADVVVPGPEGVAALLAAL
ncbi:trehalose-phosphatase [Streptomyces sp. TRM 70351]|uniref:trehalose-phosphatase n=1 Tax=Streptomyces sp. TRM 70351 TaxID=3116552 RepID=UPI002E7BB047|nr:trehalose-phosphatase [Streptomyces sp. TRM 70351]MEE1929663.1 trehalose-phosphatase [Streptomyces sp. TRM 70351]